MNILITIPDGPNEERNRQHYKDVIRPMLEASGLRVIVLPEIEEIFEENSKLTNEELLGAALFYFNRYKESENAHIESLFNQMAAYEKQIAELKGTQQP